MSVGEMALDEMTCCPIGPTDSDLDKTYTGLDRELAEEFIEQEQIV
jgi:hypothetical protein